MRGDCLKPDKYRSAVESVRREGGFVALIYVAIRSASLSGQRVESRVRRGGHGVPADRLEARWRRSIEQLTWFAAQADALWVFDNSNSDAGQPPLLLAEGAEGSVIIHHPDAIPEIAAALARVRPVR